MTTRRNDQELADYHAAQAEKYRRRIAIRSDAKLARTRRAARLLRRVAGDHAPELAVSCMSLASDLERAIVDLVNGQTGAELPFDAGDEEESDAA